MLVFACGKTKEQKYNLSLSLELVKVGGYDFLHHFIGSGTVKYNMIKP
jgi:hypothetical protein